jgi:hypothetical protein
LKGACTGAAALAGCPNNTNPAILPITTVDVDIADILSGANLGCGEGPNEILEYAAIVSLDNADAGDAGEPGGDADCTPNASGSVSGGVAACYAQLVFSNLPVSEDGGALPDGGSVNYKVRLFLYDNQTLKSAGGPGAIQAATLYNPNRKGGATLCDLPATWTANCTANEQNDIVVNAACPFRLTPGRPTDAGSEDAADAQADAPSEDAPSEDAPAGDATDENTVDAPADAPPADGGDAGAPTDATRG